jgi:hypothetical protein
VLGYLPEYFDEFSLVNGLELELIEAGRESRLLVFGYPEA